MKRVESSFGKPFLSKRFVVIAIVLCSMLFVALPATTIAAEEDDFVLGIYGNANEDDTIDMRDLTYVKLIFFGERPETELADAKYDGEINPLDFVQIKLIIVGKEKELTVLQYLETPPDMIEEPLTICMPIERIVTTSRYACEALCVFGVADKIVGVSGSSKEMGEIEEFVKDKEEIGRLSSIDIEKVISLEPDIAIAYTLTRRYYPEYEEQLSSAGIPMLQTDLYKPGKYAEEFRVLGWLLERQERAEELINFENGVLDLIKDRVSKIPKSEKPRVCALGTPYKELEVYIAGSGTSDDRRIVNNGGVNVFADMEGYKWVDSEAVLEKNPDVFTKLAHVGGYKAKSSDSLKEVQDLIIGHTGWEYITAVKNGDVYIICTKAASIHPCIFDSYIAKWLHPDRRSKLCRVRNKKGDKKKWKRKKVL
jgi:iron complex transport system substrate-binding protein